MIFRPKSLGLSWWGGDASRNGAELFEIEADFSAEIVTFRLVGGMHPPIPPLNPPLIRYTPDSDVSEHFVRLYQKQIWR